MYLTKIIKYSSTQKEKSNGTVLFIVSFEKDIMYMLVCLLKKGE